MIVAKQARAFTAAVQTANQQSSGASSVNNRANGIGARHLAQQHQRENCGESASQIAAVSSVVAKNETRSERRQVAQEVANGRRKRREQEQEEGEGEGEEKEAAQQRQHHHYQDHQHEQSASAPSGSAVEVEAAVAEDLLLVEKNPDKQQSMLMHQQQVASECGRSDSASGSCACGDTNNKQVGRLNQQAAANMRQLNLGQSTLATSLKIQQKQQKFLAAAARSATSPTGAAAATVAVSSAKLSAAPSPPLPPQQAQQHSPAPNAGAMSSPAQNDIGNYNQLHQSKHQHQQQHPSRTMKLQAGGCCQVTACSSQATAAAPTATLSSSMVMMSSLHQPPNNAITPAQASRQTPQHQQQLQQPQTQTILQRQQSHPTVAHTLQRHPLNNSNIKNNNYNHNLSHQQPQQQPHQADLTSAQQQPPQTPTSQSQQHLQQYQQLHHNHNHQHHNQQQHQYHHYYHHHQDQQRQLQQQNMDHYKFHNDCQSSVLTYEQVKRLDFVMDQTVPIHGRGNFPTLYVKLKELIRLVKYKLQKEHLIEIRDIRLNGGAASYVLAPENSHYNDLDLIFGTDLSDESQFDVIRDVVLECLKEFLPHEHLDEEVQDNYNSSYLSSENNNPTLESKVTACSTDTNQAESGQADSGSFELVQSEFKDDAQVCKSEGDAARFVGDNEICGTSEGVQTGSASVGNRTQAHGEQANLKVIDEVTDLHQQQQQAKQSANAPTSFQYQHHQAYQMPLTNCAIKEAYVHKMVKVNDDDRWSLISLGVQQSEGNCCGPTTGCPPSPPSAVQLNTNNTSLQQPPHKQFSVTLTYENEPNGLTSQSIAPMGSIENHPVQAIASNNIQQQHQCHQVTYLHQQHKSQRNHYQQKQSPNSIELKFVDKMRRKFEFSVDSFQIILDSLIQFYDYAPQSTYTKLINSHPSSTMINTRPMINKRRCSECCSGRSTIDCKTNDNSGSLSNGSIVNKENFNYNNQHHQHHHNQHNHNHHNHHTTMNGFTGATKSLLNSSRSYYQLPIEPANSSSISSMASSSGCSSSSSVVSSSSSSLSCDEDHEDLDCEADGPSSSSASISSLLSSTTMSLLSSEGSACNGSNELEQRQKNRMTSKLHEQSNYKGTNRKGSGNGTGNSKILTPHHHNQSELGSSSPYKVETVECFEKHANANTYDFEMDFGSCAVISENFYPTVIGRSEYGNFKEALYHLERKLIATRSPEEIRGGGLLKYCNLLVKNYKPTNVYQIRTLERYMCSRFFIDFSDLNQQQAKLESYLANHFSDDPMLKFDYLTILHNVVQRSTVCLMNHELRLTLNMIRDLAHVVGSQQQQNQQQQQQQYHHHQQQRK